MTYCGNLNDQNIQNLASSLNMAPEVLGAYLAVNNLLNNEGNLVEVNNALLKLNEDKLITLTQESLNKISEQSSTTDNEAGISSEKNTEYSISDYTLNSLSKGLETAPIGVLDDKIIKIDHRLTINTTPTGKYGWKARLIVKGTLNKTYAYDKDKVDDQYIKDATEVARLLESWARINDKDYKFHSKLYPNADELYNILNNSLSPSAQSPRGGGELGFEDFTIYLGSMEELQKFSDWVANNKELQKYIRVDTQNKNNIPTRVKANPYVSARFDITNHDIFEYENISKIDNLRTLLKSAFPEGDLGNDWFKTSNDIAIKIVETQSNYSNVNYAALFKIKDFTKPLKGDNIDEISVIAPITRVTYNEKMQFQHDLFSILFGKYYLGKEGVLTSTITKTNEQTSSQQPEIQKVNQTQTSQQSNLKQVDEITPELLELQNRGEAVVLGESLIFFKFKDLEEFENYVSKFTKPELDELMENIEEFGNNLDKEVVLKDLKNKNPDNDLIGLYVINKYFQKIESFNNPFKTEEEFLEWVNLPDFAFFDYSEQHEWIKNNIDNFKGKPIYFTPDNAEHAKTIDKLINGETVVAEKIDQSETPDEQSVKEPTNTRLKKIEEYRKQGLERGHKIISLPKKNFSSVFGQDAYKTKLYHAVETQNIEKLNAWIEQYFPETPTIPNENQLNNSIRVKYISETPEQRRESQQKVFEIISNKLDEVGVEYETVFNYPFGLDEEKVKILTNKFGNINVHEATPERFEYLLQESEKQILSKNQLEKQSTQLQQEKDREAFERLKNDTELPFFKLSDEQLDNDEIEMDSDQVNALTNVNTLSEFIDSVEGLDSNIKNLIKSNFGHIVVKQGDRRDYEGIVDDSVQAMFNPGTEENPLQEIIVFDTRIDQKDLVLHEAIHGILKITARLAQDTKSSDKSTQQKAAKFMQDMNNVISELTKINTTQKGKYSQLNETLTIIDELNPATKIEEFIVRVFTDAKLRNELQQIDNDNGNTRKPTGILQNIIKAISDLFGISSAYVNKVMNITFDYIGDTIFTNGYEKMFYAKTKDEHKDYARNISQKYYDRVSVKNKEGEDQGFKTFLNYDEAIKKDLNSSKNTNFDYNLANLAPEDLVLVPKLVKNNKGEWVADVVNGTAKTIWIPVAFYGNPKYRTLAVATTNGLSYVEKSDVLAIRKFVGEIEPVTTEQETEAQIAIKSVRETSNDLGIVLDKLSSNAPLTIEDKRLLTNFSFKKTDENEKTFFNAIHEGTVISFEIGKEVQRNIYGYVTKVLPTGYQVITVNNNTGKTSVVTVPKYKVQSLKHNFALERTIETVDPKTISKDGFNVVQVNVMKFPDYIAFRKKHGYNADQTQQQADYKKYLEKKNTPPVKTGDYVLVTHNGKHYWNRVSMVIGENIYSYVSTDNTSFVKVTKMKDVTYVAYPNKDAEKSYKAHSANFSEVKGKDSSTYKTFNYHNFVAFPLSGEANALEFKYKAVRNLKPGDVVETEYEGKRYKNIVKEVQSNGIIRTVIKKEITQKDGSKKRDEYYDTITIFPENVLTIYYSKENHKQLTEARDRMISDFHLKTSDGNFKVRQSDKALPKHKTTKKLRDYLKEQSEYVKEEYVSVNGQEYLAYNYYGKLMPTSIKREDVDNVSIIGREIKKDGKVYFFPDTGFDRNFHVYFIKGKDQTVKTDVLNQLKTQMKFGEAIKHTYVSNNETNYTVSMFIGYSNEMVDGKLTQGVRVAKSYFDNGEFKTFEQFVPFDNVVAIGKYASFNTDKKQQTSFVSLQSRLTSKYKDLTESDWNNLSVEDQLKITKCL